MVVLSTRALPVVFGLNLQTTDIVIILDSDWNSKMDQQAEDRAPLPPSDRIGAQERS